MSLDQRQKILDAAGIIVAEAGAYVFTVLGVLFSQYIPALRKSLEVPLEDLIPSAPQLIGASLVALLVTMFLEDQAKDHFSNLKSKFARYFLYGVAWSQVFDSIFG